MRDFKGMKRQRGRNRSGGGNQGKPQQNANRAFESNGPDNVKIRGNSQHVFERYQQLARDASSSGDRVLAENYLQHAEHYFRVIRALQPNRSTAEIIGRETYSSGFDIDFEDESGGQAAPEGEAQEGGEGQAQAEEGQQDRGQRQDRFENRDRQRDDRQRDDRPRDRDRDRDRFRDDRQRDDRPREERQRDDRPREDRQRDDRPRDERPREDRPRDDRPRDRERFRDDRPRDRDRDRDRDRPREDRPYEAPAAVEAAPVIEAAPSQMLRSEDGGESHAPAFLRPREPRAEAEAGESAPKRRRAPRPAKGEAAPAASEEEA